MVAAASPLLAKDVEETFDDGKAKVRYRVDAQDRKSGDYTEFYPSGRTAVRGTYAMDKRTGAWTSYADTGRTTETVTYRNGLREGPYQHDYPSGQPQMRGTYHADHLVGGVTTFDARGNVAFNLNYPISYDTVIKAWNAWCPAQREGPKMSEEPVLTAPFKAGRVAGESQESALRYMMLYRFLSGVTVANMGIDPTYAQRCQYGAVMLHELGHVDHTPPKPSSMDPAFYKLAYAGTSASNIDQGAHDLFTEIDDYMNDSDDHNIARVGHRQWILTPALQKTGFGHADGFSTLYSFDGGERINLNWTFIAYPGPGYYPHQMLRDGAAVSLSLNPQKFKVPTPADLTISVASLDEHFAVTATAKAKVVAIPMCPANAAWPCVVFRTGVDHPGAGRYVVKVDGLRSPSNQWVPMTYLVDVQDLPAPEPTPPPVTPERKPDPAKPAERKASG